MGNGQAHPDERKLAEKLGDEYATEDPPEGASVIGDLEETTETATNTESQEADQN